MSIVIDASALLEVWLSPSGTALAKRLEGETLHAPAHIRIEATNVIRRQRNAGILAASKADVAFDGIMGAPIQLWPFELLATRAWEIGTNATSYDATYIALAERLSIPLITHDSKLARVPGVTSAVEVF
ncbi:MAG: type II toxin-antitoxin system VapC family toxin [Ancrocorticia sp.]|uniref:type II toxin-antitoxin system VapC family toxin n=1 Tax=Ancrocorticia sp. TaxID=2593684 RepID=UPI003F8FD790